MPGNICRLLTHSLDNPYRGSQHTSVPSQVLEQRESFDTSDMNDSYCDRSSNDENDKLGSNRKTRYAKTLPKSQLKVAHEVNNFQHLLPSTTTLLCMTNSTKTKLWLTNMVLFGKRKKICLLQRMWIWCAQSERSVAHCSFQKPDPEQVYHERIPWAWAQMAVSRIEDGCRNSWKG